MAAIEMPAYYLYYVIKKGVLYTENHVLKKEHGLMV